MTREEAVKEIEKAFEPAFANYIITALTEGVTASDKDPFINKVCVSSKACEHDKEVVLNKIRAEIESKHARAKQMSSVLQMNAYTDCLQIIDKYNAESEG